MSKIVLEDFNEGDGYYKVNLAYLSKEQVEEIEALVSKWIPADEVIKACIGMCLTDASEQRFKDFGTNLRDCLAWLEKQGNQPKFKPGDWIVFNGLTLQVKEIVKEVVEVHKTTTGWASENLNKTRFFEESELDFDYHDWADFRREAAKVAMQGILASGADGWSLTLAKGYKPEEKHSYPIGIARFAIACADELIKQLKEKKK